MMASMKAGKLDCIIVKDLSRLARERIGADELIQKTFKKYNVRFIAVSEGYDSLTASSSETHTIIPFKNLLNEQYNGDTSMKVRTSQGILRRNGLFIGAFAPYGYQKAEDNKNHLVPDPYAAGVVQGIFAKKLSGMSASGIARILNKNGVLAPSEYKAKCGENTVPVLKAQDSQNGLPRQCPGFLRMWCISEHWRRENEQLSVTRLRRK